MTWKHSIFWTLRDAFPKFGKFEKLSSMFKIYTAWTLTSSKSLFRSLCEMCSNTEFFLVHIFPHSDWIRRDTKYPNTEWVFLVLSNCQSIPYFACKKSPFFFFLIKYTRIRVVSILVKWFAGVVVFNPYMVIVPILCPTENTRKPFGVLVFAGDIKWDWPGMG